MPTASFIEDAPSLASAVARAFTCYGSSPHLGTRDASQGRFTWRTYAQTGEEVAELAAGLALSLPRRSCVAIASRNREEWLLADWACAYDDFISVGVHTSWPVSKVEQVLNDAGCDAAVVSASCLPTIASAKAGGTAPRLALVVLLPTLPGEELHASAIETAEALGIRVLHYDEVLAAGRASQCTHTGVGFGADAASRPDTDDDNDAIYTLMYSSGTTGGPPKAVATPKSTWRKTNCCAGPLAAMAAADDRRAVSYMALAHGADRGVAWFTTMAGGRLGMVHAEEGTEEFFSALREVQPTFLLGMSCMWQDMYSRHVALLQPMLDQALTQRFVDPALAESLRERRPDRWTELRAALLATRSGSALEVQCLKVAREQLGGKLVIAATGGSHTPSVVKDFIRNCMSDGNEDGLHDSYGSTEFPGISRNGEISGEVELKLKPVEMAGKTIYSPDDMPCPRGEILVRRKDGLRTQYWQRPELDADAWRDGWYHTGDVGSLDYSQRPGPRLSIIDRVNALEEVYWEGDSVWIEAARIEEHVYGPIAEINMVVLVSDRNRSGLVAVVVPQESFVRQWEQNQPQPVQPGSTALLQRQHARGSVAAASSVPESLADDVLTLLARAGAGRSKWEIPVAAVIELTKWSEQPGLSGEEPLLTLTSKPKRGLIKQVYLDAVNGKFGELEASKSKTDATGVAAVARQSAGGDEQSSLIVLETLRAEAADECHSRQQHEYVSSQRRAGVDEKLPAYKKGSRIVDTAEYYVGLEKGLTTPESTDETFICKMLDALAKITPVVAEGDVPPAQALTARARDWLAPTEAADRFCFRRVRRVDRAGALVPGNCCASPVSGPTDITVGIVVDLPVQRLEYLRSMGVTYDVYRLKAASAEPLGRLRRRIGCLEACSQCPPQCIRVYFREQLMEDDRVPLAVLGIGDGSELTVMLEPDNSPFYALAQSDAQILNAALGRVMSVGLKIRACESQWIAEYRSARHSAQLALNAAVDQMKSAVQRQFKSYAASWGKECAARACPSWPNDSADGEALRRTETATRAIVEHAGQSADDEAPLTTAMRAMLSCLITGHRKVLECTEQLGGVSFCTARRQAFAELTSAIENLRTVGDALDVETRNLPVCWTLDLDWVVPPSVRETTQCFMPGCGRKVFVDQLGDHTNEFEGPCCEKGLVPADFDDGQATGGTNMGGSLSIICDVSGAEIDPEDSQHWPSSPGSDELPFRNPRVHSIESGIDRAPMYHEIIMYLHRSARHAVAEDVPGATAAVELVKAYDGRSGDTWVHDKQHIYWLHEYVKEGKQLGKNDTPASMVLRACDAFAERPSIAIPSDELVPDLPRLTPRTALPDAAKAVLTKVDGFLWLKYSDLGRIVRSVASGLARRLPAGSLVAIAGYNDFEWLIADMAIACAGMCAVGLHTTYDTNTAVDCVNRLEIAGLIVLSNLVCRSSRGQLEVWSASELCAQCRSLKLLVASDLTVDQLSAELSHARSRLAEFALGSMIDWAAGQDDEPAVQLPEPFDARGAKYATTDGSDACDMFTVLFTSGSSGAPKAVAVGTDSFVADISGDQAEAKSISTSLTVSYIPLSHSSDRYKCWQHVTLGGRVAFCFFGEQNWAAHEKDKKDSMVQYASPITGLFNQVQSLRPTNMACPPNIWAGLHEAALSAVSGSRSAAHRQHETREELLPAAAQWAASKFGNRMQQLATGGAPTPPDLFKFAHEVARRIPGTCTLVDSYGCTECGAVAVDGRQNGSKFDQVIVRLVNRPDLGFSHSDAPHARGEVVVSSPSVALGYVGNPEAEAAAFIIINSTQGTPCPKEIAPPLPDGRWYRTGDIAMVDHTGKLTLIDRATAIVSTKEHQIVRTGELEAALERMPNVLHAIVDASPDWVGAVAILSVHDEDIAGPLALGDTVDHPGHARNAAAVLPTQDLPHGLFWQVSVTNVRWTATNGMLSGELKKKRGTLLKTYKASLEELHRRCDRMILHGLTFAEFERGGGGQGAAK